MLKALIVDDDVAVEACFRKVIQWNKLGFEEPHCAYNGKEAYEIAVQHEIDVIICDLKMPMMSGMELIRRLRTDNIKVDFILLTAYEDFHAARESIGLKIYDYLLKPITLETINQLTEDLETIAKKRCISDWLDKFLDNKYNADILEALGEYNKHYVDEMIKKLSFIGKNWDDYRIFELACLKVIDIMCHYLTKMGFNDSTVENNRNSLAMKIKEFQSYKETIEFLENRIWGLIKNSSSFDELMIDVNTQRVANIKQFIDANFCDYDFSVDDVSRKFSFSKDHLNRIFKSVEGITVSKYIIQMKMKEAKRLIIETNKSFSVIAEEVGYRSLSYFTTSFKSVYRQTPSDMREKSRSLNIGE